MEQQQKLPEKLSEIAKIIFKDWTAQGKGIPTYARPYVNAMLTLNSIDDDYGLDSGQSIVAYFLANAGTWKGPTARAVKSKLKGMLAKAEAKI